jgi:hypothetical protein
MTILMNIVEYLIAHPWIVTAIFAGICSIISWLFNNVATAMISELPAPTKDSTVKYTYWFKVLNKVCGNVVRADSTAIEKSPNWEDAVNLQLKKMGVQCNPVQVNPTEEKK